MNDLKRKCPNPDRNPNCKKEISYSTKYKKERAIKRNTNSKSCAHKGIEFTDEHKENIGKSNKGKTRSEEEKKKMSESTKGKKNPMYGKRRSKKVRNKISESKKGKKCPDQSKRMKENNPAKHPKIRKKISKSVRGEKNGMYGKFGIDNPNYGSKRSEETKKKQRLSRIKEIKDKHGQISPNYNSKAISIILQKAKEFGITDLQHAENGGEYQVCGYFVDGHSKEKNIVIEYYEPFHKNQIERDERRKREIMKELGCIFIVIWE